MNNLKLVHKGSTKDVYQTGENYLFKFSDRYSVFDWGEMPDHIQNKGIALARFTKHVYKHFESKGIKTHLLDLPCKEGEMIVTPFEVVRGAGPLPQRENVFIPLEVIFRIGVAHGSSLLKRKHGYKEGERFEYPMIEFTTKLERFDRPLTHIEAQELANLNIHEWKELLETTRSIAMELEDLFYKQGIMLWDGKVEFAAGKYIGNKREIILVDSIGPDELRLTHGEVQLSKEIIRQFYRRSHWFEELDKVKTLHGERFKEFIEPPIALPTKFKKNIEEMYTVLGDMMAQNTGAKEKMNQLLPSLKEVSL